MDWGKTLEFLLEKKSKKLKALLGYFKFSKCMCVLGVNFSQCIFISGKTISTVEDHLFFSLSIKIKMLSVSQKNEYEVPARWGKQTCHCLTFWMDAYLMHLQKHPGYSDCQFRFIARWENLDPVLFSECAELSFQIHLWCWHSLSTNMGKLKWCLQISV